ncbi:hypothetical protein ACFQRK_13280 [Parapedobacter sp. GCM10030251]|uniref:hypothetical protein n=1 Tax=Parapedobacter sp. GCM10030251 TaxID=3273419 RepID=UPI00360FF71E
MVRGKPKQFQGLYQSRHIRNFGCLIVEHEPLVIDMMKDLVGSRDDLKLLGVVTEMEQLAKVTETIVPEIIFLDLVIPLGNCGDFHFGKLPSESSIVVVSAIPLSHYKNRYQLANPRQLYKPVSLERFNRCVDEVILERIEQQDGQGG